MFKILLKIIIVGWCFSNISASCITKEQLNRLSSETEFRGVKIPNYFMSQETFYHVADDYLSPNHKELPAVECGKFKSWLMPQNRLPVITTQGVRGIFRPFYRLIDSIHAFMTWPARYYNSLMLIDKPVSWTGVRIIVVDSTKFGSTSTFDYFFDVWLPKIRSPFILINFGDHGVPNDVTPRTKEGKKGFAMTDRDKRRWIRALDNPYLVAWYALNFDGSIKHSKIRYYPIGDFDATSRTRELNRMSLKTSRRKFKVYSDSTLVNSSQRMRAYGLMSRSDIHEEIKNNPLIEIQNGYMRKDLQHKKRTEYMFSLSLVGNGYDCHRTWESLYLGNIVLLQSSPLDPLFEGLPVVIIKDWSEINETNLKKWAAKYHDASTNPKYREKLTSAYWLKMLEADIQAGEKKFNTYRPSYAKPL
jgi:hypothetical protein